MSLHHVGVCTRLQEKLLAPQNHDLKPDMEFLESFAGVVVVSKWPALAAFLGFSDEEVEEVRKEQDHALGMLRKWASREGATYGQLYRRLKTISLH